jgi:S1-C subfamily serine protease
VKEIFPQSLADKAGIPPGAILRKANDFPIHSQADLQYALHKAPLNGELSLSWEQNGKRHSARLPLIDGWKKTNLTWRPSLLDILPSLTLFGTDLTIAEKKKLRLDETRLAFRQDAPVHSQARAVGVREGDIIIGIDNQVMHMTVGEFLAYIRRNFLVEERITLNVIREGKRIDLPMKLK